MKLRFFLFLFFVFSGYVIGLCTQAKTTPNDVGACVLFCTAAIIGLPLVEGKK